MQMPRFSHNGDQCEYGGRGANHSWRNTNNPYRYTTIYLYIYLSFYLSRIYLVSICEYPLHHVGGDPGGPGELRRQQPQHPEEGHI